MTKGIGGAEKNRNKKFTQLSHKDRADELKRAKERKNNRRAKSKLLAKVRMEHGAPRSPLPNYSERYARYRLIVIANNESKNGMRCEFAGCERIPGVGCFKQVDHILDRGRWSKWVFEEWNGVESCGHHEDLMKKPNGEKWGPHELLRNVRVMLPHRAEIIRLKLIEDGRIECE